MFFFCKQKTAYEIRLSLVGSEMCIRDSPSTLPRFHRAFGNSPSTLQKYQYPTEHACDSLSGVDAVFLLVAIVLEYTFGVWSVFRKLHAQVEV